MMAQPSLDLAAVASQMPVPPHVETEIALTFTPCYTSPTFPRWRNLEGWQSGRLQRS